MNSLGTGLVTNGVFFLAKSVYGFSDRSNYLLGIAIGATYILGACFAGRAVATLRTRFPALGSRGVLALLMLLLGATSLIPWLASRQAGGAGAGGEAGVWGIWLLVLLYSPLTGVLWPLVESYLSGGKRGEPLRHSVGIFNVVWSASVVLSFWALSPLIENHAIAALSAMALIHVLLAGFALRFFSKEPAPHLHDTHEPHPPIYARLLVVLRRLLPLAYVISSVLAPYLPGAMTTLAIPDRYQPLVASSWLAPRVLTFFILQRWHGWHGRWSLPIVGTLLLVLGCAVAVLSPIGLSLGLSPLACTLAMMGGLACFGIGKAAIYAGALYYAMEVGAAEVDAGGTHEALIGIGYFVGPLCGLLPLLAVQQGLLPESYFRVTVIATVALIVLGVMASLLKVRTAKQAAPSQHTGTP